MNSQGAWSETDAAARLSCSAVVGGGAARDADADEEAAVRAVPPLPALDVATADLAALRALSDADVDALLADSARLDAFAAALPPLVDNSAAAARCRALAAELRALQAQTAPLRAAAAEQHAALEAAAARHRAALEAQRAADAHLSAAGLADALAAAEAAADADGAALVDQLRAGQLEPDAFARAYLAARTEAYTRRMKHAALTQQPFP